MESIINLESTIKAMAKERGLPAVTDVYADIKLKNGKLYFFNVSFYVGENQIDAEWSNFVSQCDKDGNPLDIMGIIAKELDDVYKVTDDLYEQIAERHLGGCDFEKIIDDVYVEVNYGGRYTYMLTFKKEGKGPFDIHKARHIANNFNVRRYFVKLDKAKERRMIEDESDRYNRELLRRIA